VDPLRWFGVLTPPALKQSRVKTSFKKSYLFLTRKRKRRWETAQWKGVATDHAVAAGKCLHRFGDLMQPALRRSQATTSNVGRSAS
jgi:hypothetical protein